MNLSYFRKSNYSFEDTTQKTLNLLKTQGWTVVGEVKNKKNGIVSAYKAEWLDNFASQEEHLLPLLPTTFFIVLTDSGVHLGAAEAKILSVATPNPALRKLAKTISDEIKLIVNQAGGVSELKPTVVKLYSTMTCPYCKMEKSWLDQNNIAHQVVYVDLDQKAGQEMVEKTGQMGVPVTEISYGEGEPEYIVGFDKSQLAEILNIKE